METTEILAGFAQGALMGAIGFAGAMAWKLRAKKGDRSGKPPSALAVALEEVNNNNNKPKSNQNNQELNLLSFLESVHGNSSHDPNTSIRASQGGPPVPPQSPTSRNRSQNNNNEQMAGEQQVPSPNSISASQPTASSTMTASTSPQSVSSPTPSLPGLVPSLLDSIGPVALQDTRTQRAALGALRGLAMSPAAIGEIIEACGPSVSDPETKRKAISTINSLALVDDSRHKLTQPEPKKNLITYLLSALKDNEPPKVRRAAIQALGSLQINSELMKLRMVDGGIIPLLVDATSEASDRRLQYHGALLLHDFARLAPNREKIVSANALKVLVPLFGATSTNLQKIILETIIILCINADNLIKVMELGILNPLIGCLRSRDAEVQSLAAAMLHDLALKEENLAPIVDVGALEALARLANSKDPSTRKVVVETLLLFFSSGNFTAALIKAGALKPFVTACSLPDVGDNIQYYVAALLYDLALETTDHAIVSKIIDAGAIPCLTSLCQKGRENVQLLAGKAFVFLAVEDDVAARGLAACLQGLLSVAVSSGTGWASIANLSIRVEEKRAVAAFPDAIASILSLLNGPNIGNIHKSLVATLLTLSGDAACRRALVRTGAVPRLITAMSTTADTSLQREVIATLGFLFDDPLACRHALNDRFLAVTLPLARSSSSSMSWISRWTLDRLFTVPAPTEKTQMFLGGSYITASPHIKLDSDGMSIRNDAWAFETIIADVLIGEGKWYYEVTIGTPGVLQIGVAAAHASFNPKTGVGDNSASYGWDGARVVKWHGRRSAPDTKYGLPWTEGDVVGVHLDADKGTLAFSLNGIPLGTAFEGLEGRDGWRPALSIDTGKEAKVNFGGVPFTYPPPAPWAAVNAVSSFTGLPWISLDLTVEEDGSAVFMDIRERPCRSLSLETAVSEDGTVTLALCPASVPWDTPATPLTHKRNRSDRPGAARPRRPSPVALAPSSAANAPVTSDAEDSPKPITVVTPGNASILSPAGSLASPQSVTSSQAGGETGTSEIYVTGGRHRRRGGSGMSNMLAHLAHWVNPYSLTWYMELTLEELPDEVESFALGILPTNPESWMDGQFTCAGPGSVLGALNWTADGRLEWGVGTRHQAPVGQPWAVGDIVGIGYDERNGTLMASRNGALELTLELDQAVFGGSGGVSRRVRDGDLSVIELNYCSSIPVNHPPRRRSVLSPEPTSPGDADVYHGDESLGAIRSKVMSMNSTSLYANSPPRFSTQNLPDIDAPGALEAYVELREYLEEELTRLESHVALATASRSLEAQVGLDEPNAEDEARHTELLDLESSLAGISEEELLALEARLIAQASRSPSIPSDSETSSARHSDQLELVEESDDLSDDDEHEHGGVEEDHDHDSDSHQPQHLDVRPRMSPAASRVRTPGTSARSASSPLGIPPSTLARSSSNTSLVVAGSRWPLSAQSQDAPTTARSTTTLRSEISTVSDTSRRSEWSVLADPVAPRLSRQTSEMSSNAGGLGRSTVGTGLGEAASGAPSLVRLASVANLSTDATSSFGQMGMSRMSSMASLASGLSGRGILEEAMAAVAAAAGPPAPPTIPSPSGPSSPIAPPAPPAPSMALATTVHQAPTVSVPSSAPPVSVSASPADSVRSPLSDGLSALTADSTVSGLEDRSSNLARRVVGRGMGWMLGGTYYPSSAPRFFPVIRNNGARYRVNHGQNPFSYH